MLSASSSFISFGYSGRMFVLVTEVLYCLEFWIQKSILCELEQPFTLSVPCFHFISGLQRISLFFKRADFFLKHHYLYPSFTIKFSSERILKCLSYQYFVMREKEAKDLN